MAAEVQEPEPPPGLAFVELTANDDSFGVTQDVLSLDVLANDTFSGMARIVSVDQPTVGSVSIENDELVVSLPPSFAGDLVFTYVMSNESGVESTASVTVHSLNVLAPAGQTATTEPDVLVSRDAISERVVGLFTGLLEIRLNSVQLGFLAIAPLLTGLLALVLRRRDVLVSVTNSPRSRSVALDFDRGMFNLRHNALVWSSGRTRKISNGKLKTLVELPNGERTWVDTDLIIDTGY